MTGKNPQTPVLAIGAIMGDIDSEREWGAIFGALSKRVKSLRDGLESPLHLTVVLHVDGRLKPNEFEGVRTGRLRKRDNHLTVQAAVPTGPLEDRMATLSRLLQDAVAEAERFSRNRGIAEELGAIRSLVAKVND
jgi:hypothetical protein